VSGPLLTPDDFLLGTIESPSDLRKFDYVQLNQISDELRAFLVQSLSKTGGHLAAGLGVVELTIALHYVFNTPFDRLVWDVGHQAYPHKILTGRRHRMSTIRQKDGLSGFPRREESEYDTFGTGHSSTSISAALGMAIAARQEDENRQCIAVIGDGALSGGMSFEALNHAGTLRDINLMVILNDNDMSISRPVGAVSRYLTRVLSSHFYNSVKNTGQSFLKNMPQLRDLVDRWEEHVKGMVLPGTLWEELGFTYIGPIDGHDLPRMIETLKNMRSMKGPRFFACCYSKGQGV
jgi:1-deoxy-D-xylulose-5-phosphate synthase